MNEWSWRRESKSHDRSRDDEIDRRAIEIMERCRCSWIEAWARASAEHGLIDGRDDIAKRARSRGRGRVTGRVSLSEQIGRTRGNLAELARSRDRSGRAPGRVSLSEQIGRTMRPRSGTVAPGRTTLSASLPATVMRSAERAEIDPAAAELLARARHGGAPLDRGLRAQLEVALGAKLDGVRIHTGSHADDAARALGARAFAIGNDVFFRDGAYDPQQRDGQQLIAHEIAHTVQSRTAAAPTGNATVVSQPGDAPEREADAFADAFVRGVGAQQPDAAPGHDTETGHEDMRELSGSKGVPGKPELLGPGLVFGSRGATGAPLDPQMRTFFESRFGRDFSEVRVHTGGEAAFAARALGAAAFTVGQHIVLGDDDSRPETRRGQRVLAHELAHVAQQCGVADLAPANGAPTETHEREAELSADAIGWGGYQERYGDIAGDVGWHAESRPLAGMPALSPSGACIQRVQLSYDDGPDAAGNTRAVLGSLNAAAARATFYLVGKRVAQGENWRTVFDIAASGHWLGNHAFDWNDATDNHIFLSGTSEQRAQKILQTEWAIRDALIRGRDDAQRRNAWTTIPQSSRDYILDVIAHGTGRFRTPGFRSHAWSSDGNTTTAALYSANQVLAAAGLRQFAITEVTSWGITREGVTVDPEDWRPGRTQSDIETGVTSRLNSNSDSILLHSRIGATAAATPTVVADITRRGWTFEPTAQGSLGATSPGAGFAGLRTVSNPPTSAEIAQARAFFRRMIPSIGGYFAGSTALGILQMAQRAGSAEVDAFLAEIRRTTVQIPADSSGLPARTIPLANWMNENPEWRLFSGFYENWRTQQPFPRNSGVTR